MLKKDYTAPDDVNTASRETMYCCVCRSQYISFLGYSDYHNGHICETCLETELQNPSDVNQFTILGFLNFKTNCIRVHILAERFLNIIEAKYDPKSMPLNFKHKNRDYILTIGSRNGVPIMINCYRLTNNGLNYDPYSPDPVEVTILEKEIEVSLSDWIKESVKEQL